MNKAEEKIESIAPGIKNDSAWVILSIVNTIKSITIAMQKGIIISQGKRSNFISFLKYFIDLTSYLYSYFFIRAWKIKLKTPLAKSSIADIIITVEGERLETIINESVLSAAIELVRARKTPISPATKPITTLHTVKIIFPWDEVKAIAERNSPKPVKAKNKNTYIINKLAEKFFPHIINKAVMIEKIKVKITEEIFSALIKLFRVFPMEIMMGRKQEITEFMVITEKSRDKVTIRFGKLIRSNMPSKNQKNITAKIVTIPISIVLKI